MSIAGSITALPRSTAGSAGVTKRLSRWAPVVAAIGLVGIAAFQVALALGAPWGVAAWGGIDEGELATGRGVASGLAALVLVAATLVVLGRAGFWSGDRHRRFFRWASWAVVAILLLSGLGNFASSSNWERLLMGPLAWLLALACLLVALGSPDRQT